MMLLLAAGAFPVARAQQAEPRLDTLRTARQVSASIYFRIGESNIDPEFEGNKYRLALFISALDKILADSNYVVSRLVVMGTASPDGKLERNLDLAGARADALACYLSAHTSIPAERIETVNGGENWDGLRQMMESSDALPHKEAMLGLMRIQSPKTRKHKMMYYADSKPWLWMYDHFFDQLRIGVGGAQGRAALSRLSRENWMTLQTVIRDSELDKETKRMLLDVVTQEPDAALRLQRLRELAPDAAALLQDRLITELLGEASALSSDNWTLLREKVTAETEMPSREAVLRIIDSIPAARGREQALQSLDEGRPYRYILDRFFPELLVSSRVAHPEHVASAPASDSITTLSAENWRRLRDMVAVSEIPGKESVLELIDSEPDAAVREQRLRALGNGRAYRYINEAFFPELLYGISPASKENREKLELAIGESDLPHRAEILEIIRSTSPGPEREEAIRALDNGESWRKIGELILPELLQSTENIPLTGSGMSFYYELSPKAKARVTLLTEQIAAQESAQAARSEARTSQAASLKTHTPLLALKTDLMLWGGVMPGFEMGTWTPNLSAEVCFARRWSAQAGYAYSNWDAFGSGKGLYAVSAADLEVRAWFGKPSRFKGFYLGVFGTYGQYDVQEEAQGQTGSFWTAGLGAGYLLPLSEHWGLDAEIRGGYRSARNERYDIVPEHYYINSKSTEGKFLPQLRLQIVYRFGLSGK